MIKHNLIVKISETKTYYFLVDDYLEKDRQIIFNDPFTGLEKKYPKDWVGIEDVMPRE
jgi:hypothetical protein